MPAHGVGGLEDHVLMLAKGVAKKGNKITVITTKHPKNKLYEKAGGIEIYYLKNTLPGKYSASWWEESVKKFEELNKKERFDIVHSQSTGALCFLKKKMNKKYGIPVVISMHGTHIDEIKTIKNTYFSWKHPISTVKGIILLLFYKYRYFSERSTIKSADIIIATSNEQRVVIKNNYFFDNKDIRTVFNGINTKTFAPKSSNRIRKKYKIKKEKIILSVSKLEKEKGVQNIIKALPNIIKKSDAKLIVVGDGSYSGELKRMVSKLDMQKYVIFTGSVPLNELPNFFNECDVFVNPTIRQNGYDLTILEAMSCKKPVIVSKIGSVPTAVSSKEGILVKPSNIKELSNAVIRILNNQQLARKLGKNARKKVVGHFSLENMVNKTIDVYKSLVNK